MNILSAFFNKLIKPIYRRTEFAYTTPFQIDVTNLNDTFIG